MENEESRFQLGTKGIVGFIMAIAMVVLLFFFMKGVFSILAWAAPFLLLASLIINYRTVVNFLKWIYELLFRNPIMGIVTLVLMFFGFPVVAGFLFGKSIFDRKVKLLVEANNRENEFIEYEEVDDQMELKQIEYSERSERDSE